MTGIGLLNKLDSCRRTSSGNILMHLEDLEDDFIELKGDFIEDVKKNINTKLHMVAMGLEDIDPLTKLAMIFIDKAC